MEHLLLKAATTATDQGVFEAVISTATVDRDKDIVDPSAMVRALSKWAALGKLVPLAWAHTETVVGNVDPATARIENKEVIATGWIDQGTELGAEAWRLVKSGTLSFSFGYLIPAGGATERPVGGLSIKELDVFEISVVPVGPANNDTRVLSFKSAEELREETKRVEREVEQTRVPDVPPVDYAAELVEVKGELANAQRLLEEASKPTPPDAKAQREKAKREARELEEQQLPDVPAVAAKMTAAGKQGMADRMREMADMMAMDPMPMTSAEMATEMRTMAAEMAAGKSAPTGFDELQEVKAQLAEMAKGLEDLSKKADVTDKEPVARSVDPLRQQAEAVALEVASDGMSLRKPPPTVAPKRTEPALTLAELKQRTRTEMLGVLSGGTIE